MGLLAFAMAAGRKAAVVYGEMERKNYEEECLRRPKGVTPFGNPGWGAAEEGNASAG